MGRSWMGPCFPQIFPIILNSPTQCQKTSSIHSIKNSLGLPLNTISMCDQQQTDTLDLYCTALQYCCNQGKMSPPKNMTVEKENGIILEICQINGLLINIDLEYV